MTYRVPEIDYDPQRVATGRELHHRWTAACERAFVMLDEVIPLAKQRDDGWELMTLRLASSGVSDLMDAVRKRGALPTDGWVSMFGNDAAPGAFEPPYDRAIEAADRVRDLFVEGLHEIGWDWQRNGFPHDWPDRKRHYYIVRRSECTYPRALSTDPAVLDPRGRRDSNRPATGPQLRARWDTVCQQAVVILKRERHDARYSLKVARKEAEYWNRQPDPDLDRLTADLSVATSAVVELWHHVDAGTLLPTTPVPEFRLSTWRTRDCSSDLYSAVDAADRVRSLFLNGLDEPHWNWQRDGFPPDWPTTSTDRRKARKASRQSQRALDSSTRTITAAYRIKLPPRSHR